MTTKYDPKKDFQDSAIDAAWVTEGLAIVNFSLKALGARLLAKSCSCSYWYFWQYHRELWKVVRRIGNGRYVERLHQISE